MNGNSKCRLLEKLPGGRAVKDELPYEPPVVKAGRAAKAIAASMLAAVLAISVSGCDLGDIMPPLNSDIPFEESKNTADDMEDIEKPPTEPDENSFVVDENAGALGA